MFTINNVFQVHPETKQATTRLQQFVVTANKTFSARRVRRSTSIRPSSRPVLGRTSPARRRTLPRSLLSVLRAPATQNLLHHRDAFAFASCDLVMPRGVDMASRQVYDGVSMRLVAPVRRQSGHVPVPPGCHVRLDGAAPATGLPHHPRKGSPPSPSGGFARPRSRGRAFSRQYHEHREAILSAHALPTGRPVVLRDRRFGRA